jgi:hypothetical protein
MLTLYKPIKQTFKLKSLKLKKLEEPVKHLTKLRSSFVGLGSRPESKSACRKTG